MINTALKNKDPKNNILFKYFKNMDNWNQLESLYSKRLSAKESSVQFELDLLENEIQILLSKDNYTEDELIMIDNIKAYYANTLLKNQLLFTSSPIYNEEDCLNKIFDEKQKEYIKTKKESLIKTVNEDIKRYRNYGNGELSSSEKQIIFNYLSSDYIDIDNKEIKSMIDNIISIILEPGKINDYYEVKFLFDYINRRQCKYLEYERCKVYLDHKMPAINKDSGEAYRKDFPNPYTNGGAHQGGIIVVNTGHMDSRRLNDVEYYGQDLYDYIEVVSHESLHAKQFNDYVHRRYTIESFAEIVNNLLYSKWDFYRTNYDFVPIEYQANARCYQETINCVKKYNFDPNYAEKRIKYEQIALSKLKVNNAYAMAIPDINDEKSTPMILDRFIVDGLAKKCESNPKFAKYIKQLQLFFHENGKLMNMDELVDSFYRLETDVRDFAYDYECDYEKMFMPFFTVALENYDLESTRENNAKNARLQRIIRLVVKNEVNQLVLMVKGYNYFSEFEKTHLVALDKRFRGTQNNMIEERLNRIKKYLPYIKDEEEVRRITTIMEPILADVGRIKETGKSR